MDGRLIVGANEHQEICALHLAGGVAILPDQIIRCFQIAALKCKAHATIIQVSASLCAHSTPTHNPSMACHATDKTIIALFMFFNCVNNRFCNL